MARDTSLSARSKYKDATAGSWQPVVAAKSSMEHGMLWVPCVVCQNAVFEGAGEEKCLLVCKVGKMLQCRAGTLELALLGETRKTLS